MCTWWLPSRGLLHEGRDSAVDMVHSAPEGACSGLSMAVPCRRLSVAGILRHPWFRTELSPTLISLNHDLLDLPTAVRPAILFQVIGYTSYKPCTSVFREASPRSRPGSASLCRLLHNCLSTIPAVECSRPWPMPLP
jgi:hypothetical protein